VKIGEILATGALRKAEATDEMSDTMAIFSKIWGKLNTLLILNLPFLI